ncbi:MAG: DUF5110 domain-containing protein [Prevotella sp.]|nr:DUF5110 domain-containing protein [Prevotella sp.]
MVSITINTNGQLTFNTPKGERLMTEGNYSLTPITTGLDQGCFKVAQTFAFDANEHIYGIGLIENGKMNQRGENRRMIQSNLEDFQNIFHSEKGYAVFWDNYSPTQLTDRPNDGGMSLTSEVGELLDYYFIYGKTADGVVALIRELSGDVPMIPLYAYGYWQSRERYKSSRELTEVLDKYRQLQVPIDGMILDWQYWDSNYLWNAMEFLNPQFSKPQAMIDHVHRQNAHLSISIWQSFGPGTKGYRQLDPRGLLYNFETWPQSGLGAWPPNMDYPSGVRVYKPYVEEARDIYWDNLQRLFNLGCDTWWMDSTDPDHHSFKESDLDEPTPLDEKSSGINVTVTYRRVRNAFPLLCTKGVYEHQRKVSSDKRVFILTRSGFAGQQRYASNVWTGDVQSTWENLRRQIPMGLNFSLSANPLFNSDIGGFFSSAYNKGDATTGARNPLFQELYVRWMQFGAFCPMMRSHGTETYREIYYFGKEGEPVFDALANTIRLRYRLLPYIYSTAWDVTNRRGTFMRALMMDFSNDDKCLDINDEYMFGRQLLVAPIVNAQYTTEKRTRNTDPDAAIPHFNQKIQTTKYLPAGTRWYDFNTGMAYEGGRDVTIETTLATVPLFVRAGSIIPIGPDVQYAKEKAWDNLELRVYPGADGNFTLYEDEGDNYNYEQGKYTLIPIHWNNSSRTLTIGARQGAYDGMLKQRTFRIVVPGKATSKTVHYNGKRVKVVI